MRTITQTLEAAQRSGSAAPYPKVEIVQKIGGVTRLAWERLYEGAEEEGFHALAMPADGSLIRCWCDPDDEHLNVQRVASPGEESDYSSWTDTGETCGAMAATALGTEVLIFYVAPTSPFHIWLKTSNDSGASFGVGVDQGIASDEDGVIAACHKSNGDAVVIYSRAGSLYARKRTGGAWGSETDSGHDFDSIGGLAIVHMGDWNIAVTGVEQTTLRPGVWTCVFGDGYSAAPGTWTGLMELSIAEAGSEVFFQSPCLDAIDRFRMFFIEWNDATMEARLYWTYTAEGLDYINNLWREPIPFNLLAESGLAICHVGSFAWLTRPDGVWRASLAPGPLEVTSDVLQLTAHAFESNGGIDIVLANSTGKYAGVDSGDLPPITLGAEVRFSPGLHTTQGPEVSAGPAYWITGWDYVSAAARSTFVLHACDGWGLLERWKARRQLTWTAGDKNVFQLLKWLFGRAGLRFSTRGGGSSQLTELKPALTVHPRASGRDTVLNLLSLVPDVVFFEGDHAYAKYLDSDEETNYAYGTDHPLLEARYARRIAACNRAQAFGAEGVHLEQFNWPQVDLVYDIITQALDSGLEDPEDLWARCATLVEAAETRSRDGTITVPMNVAQEMYDVIEVSDARVPLEGEPFRVLGLTHVYDAGKGVYRLKIDLGAMGEWESAEMPEFGGGD